MQNPRLIYLDLLKSFAIFLVIWGHCIQFFLSSYECYDYIYLVIYSFHMPLFMIISGFFSWNSFNLSSKQFLLKKVRELILPVVSWGFIFEITRIVINLFEGKPTYIFYDLKAFYIQNLWFLKCLFICYVLAYFCFRHRHINYLVLSITIIASQFIISHNICTMYPAFLYGILLKKHNKIANNYYTIIGTFILFVILLHYWNASFWPIPDMLQGICNSNLAIIQDYIFKGGYRILLGIIGSMFFICFFFKVFKNRRNKTINIIADWGTCTLGVYILQSFIIEYTLSNYINFDNSNYHLFHYIYSPFISIVFIIISTIFVRHSYKYEFLSFLLWGKKNRSRYT